MRSPIYDHPGTAARLAVLHDIAAELGATVNQVVLAWLMADGVIPIVGVSTVAQLDEAVNSSTLTIDEKMKARLDAPR